MEPMTIPYLIKLCEARLADNARQRAAFELRGQLEAIASLDANSAATESTLAQLRTLLPET